MDEKYANLAVVSGTENSCYPAILELLERKQSVLADSTARLTSTRTGRTKQIKGDDEPEGGGV
jgi:hypothetical protein